MRAQWIVSLLCGWLLQFEICSSRIHWDCYVFTQLDFSFSHISQVLCPPNLLYFFLNKSKWNYIPQKCSYKHKMCQRNLKVLQTITNKEKWKKLHIIQQTLKDETISYENQKLKKDSLFSTTRKTKVWLYLAFEQLILEWIPKFVPEFAWIGQKRPPFIEMHALSLNLSYLNQISPYVHLGR